MNGYNTTNKKTNKKIKHGLSVQIRRNHARALSNNRFRPARPSRPSNIISPGGGPPSPSVSNPTNSYIPRVGWVPVPARLRDTWRSCSSRSSDGIGGTGTRFTLDFGGLPDPVLRRTYTGKGVDSAPSSLAVWYRCRGCRGNDVEAPTRPGLNSRAEESKSGAPGSSSIARRPSGCESTLRRSEYPSPEQSVVRSEDELFHRLL